MTKKREYLFTYGTLLPGKAPPEIAPAIQQLRRVGRGFVHGRLYDLGDYPGAILTRNGPTITGVVFELPEGPDVLGRIDAYEGFDPSQPEGSLFVRRRCSVTLENHKKGRCWVYVYNRRPGSAPNIVSGDYMKARNHRSR